MMHENDKRLKRKVRASYITSTISIALVLFLLGSVGYLIINALDATNRMKESVSVYVMLKDNIAQEQKDEINAKLTTESAVREVVYVSKDEAAADFKANTGEDFEQFLKFNPLPDSYEVKLKAEGSDEVVLGNFEKRALSWEGVDEVVYQRSVVERIGSNINKFNTILMLFGGALLIISLILLNNTIRVSVFSKRYIISTMKMVGATRWFILKPFIKSAILQGIYSALIAAAMFIGMVWALREGLPEIRLSAEVVELAWIVGGMFVLGVLISLIFTIFVVNKFVKMPTGAIHYY